MLVRLLILILLVAACSTTSRTKYQPLKKKQGYEDKNIEYGLRVTSFKGNAYTNKADADLFAKFRAIEVCDEAEFKLTNILKVSDKTISKDVLRTTGTGFPSYYYGMSPYYSRYNTGISIGYAHTSSSTYAETYQLPEFEVVYECVNKAYGPEIAVREVSAEEMKLLVKDLKGGLQVEKVLGGSANAKSIEVGDVIIRVDGERVDRSLALFRRFTGGKKEVPVEIFREGKRMKKVLRSHEVSEFIEESQKRIVASACSKKEIKERPICLK